MADADEDVIPTGNYSPEQVGEGDADGDEDDPQDFRFLSTGSGSSKGALPKRGVKDFEPNPTRSQTSALDESRMAMHEVLSAVRVQAAGKNYNVGQFVDERQRQNTWDLKLRAELVGEDWDARCVVVYNAKGTFSRTMGRADRRSWIWLLPEEALFLLERGTLDIRWPDIPHADASAETEAQDEESEAREREVGEEKEDEPVGELPMSLQGAYATFVGRSGLNLDRYLVYTGLRRLGYVLQRAPTWYDYDESKLTGDTASTLSAADGALEQKHKVAGVAPSDRAAGMPSLIHRLISFLVNPRLGTSCPSGGPLLAPGLYRNYNDVFRSLSLIPHHEVPHSRDPFAASPKGTFTVAFDVWRPSSSFKKRNPPPIDFYVTIVDARATDVPTMEEIGALLDTMPYDELPADKRAEAKIKHGKRSVILAIVDLGVVSYLRFNEASIGSHKIFEEKTARASKGRGRGGGGGSRGGRGGARGRGRGRGRGRS